MERKKIASDIKEFIQNEFPKPGLELTDSTKLLDQVLLDSLAIISTTLFLESQFDIDIVESDLTLEVFGSIDSLSEFVHSKLTTIPPSC